MEQASAEKLEHARPDETKRIASEPQNEQLARTPELLLPKKKVPGQQFKLRDQTKGSAPPTPPPLTQLPPPFQFHSNFSRGHFRPQSFLF